jgi:uncharacterized repeat protein (TIGR03806 family)
MLGLVFHPEYAKAGSPHRGFIYVFYSWTDDPVVIGRPSQDKETMTRLSRFTVDPATGVVDRNSELVLMAQRDLNIYHAGGGMFFHPRDGFLYISVGDEGGARDFRSNTQRIDRNLFSGVLRIDVDRRGGNISHPIKRHPVDGKSDHYYIPNDNPFVGRTDALEEFYAIGLRSPHRMTYDPVDDLAWIGDIGQSALEEVSVLEFNRGPLNFQWNIREGTREGFAQQKGPEGTLGIWTDPIWEFGRDQGRSIIGGFVYRGARYPALRGKYLVGDFGSGRIWALSYRKGAPPKLEGVELLAHLSNTSYNYRGGEGGLTSFGRSHDGEPYLLFHGLYTRIAKLVEAQPNPGNIPATLSEAGVFSDTKNLVPAAGLVPYDVNLPQWTDGIPARRWIAVPAGKQVKFDPAGRWGFPPGTVLVQHFEVVEAGATDGKARRLETRLLVGAANGSFYAASYRWNAEGSDADLVTTDSSTTISVPVGESGRPRSESWAFTRWESCLECHSPEAGFVLGVKARQLHRKYEYAGGVTDQQLRAWNHIGLFEKAPGRMAMASVVPLAAPDQQAASVEHRVRSYLDVNCAHCHGAKAIRAAWNGNITAPRAEQGLIFGPLVGENTSANLHVIAPRDVGGSVLHRRASTIDVIDRMPPLGAQRIDRAFLNVLEQWIAELPRDESVPPQLVRARRRGDAIEATFSEALHPGAETGGAERAEYYALDGGGKILSAKLKDDGRTVALETSPLAAGQSYTLTVTGVVDRATKPNRIREGTMIKVQN